MHSSKEEGAESDAFWQTVCRETKFGKTNVTKEEQIEAVWKSSEQIALFAAFWCWQRTDVQAEMESMKPEVRFILEALVGSLVTLSSLSEVHQTKAHVVSDSIIFFGNPYSVLPHKGGTSLQRKKTKDNTIERRLHSSFANRWTMHQIYRETSCKVRGSHAENTTWGRSSKEQSKLHISHISASVVSLCQTKFNDDGVR